MQRHASTGTQPSCRQQAVTVCSGGASERRLGKVSGDWPLTRLPPHLTRMNREEFSSAAAVHSMSIMHALLQCSAGAVQGVGPDERSVHSRYDISKVCSVAELA